MSVSDAYVKIILAILSILSALISVYVIPYLRSKQHYNEFAMLNDFVINAVRAANQLYTPDEWKEKKQYVLNLVNNYLSQNIGLGFTEDQIDAIIEGIVREIKIVDGGKNSTNNFNNID